ncbi:MAG TPA: hypothetical protein VHC96_03000 [Puia sp.]|jgi:hypothetical protein|nr:hypothetical protein [Puia sp.]
MKKNTKPIRKKEEVQQSNDERIDQDFPGFPHPPSKKEIITHNGSANAFGGTETPREEDEAPKRDNVFPDRGK